MDKKLFEAWLAEVAVLKQTRLAPDLHGWRDGSEPLTQLTIDHVKPQTRPCKFCDQQCSGCLNHSFTLDKKIYRKIWITTCDTCKKRVDLATGKIIQPANNTGVYYQARGLRTAGPGKTLGRKPKQAFWNEPVKIYTEEEAAEIRLRHAGMLDRLAQLRDNK